MGYQSKKRKKWTMDEKGFRDQEVVVVSCRVVGILYAKEGGWRSERLEEGS